MSKFAHPHDTYFRASMSDLRVAEDFLRAHLPENILAKIDWSSLQLEPNHHIDKSLTESITDVLYRVKFGDKSGYIIILVEHQSTVDPMMPFRMLCYVVKIMQRYMEKRPGATLPLVVPIVFYSGKNPYNHTTDIFELFGDLESEARKFFLNPFRLIDLSSISDEALQQHSWSGIMELAQKHSHEKAPQELIKTLSSSIKDILGQDGGDYIDATLEYIGSTADLKDPGEFARIVNTEISSKLGERVMSLASRWHDKGEVVGIQKGLEQGLVKGIAAGIDQGMEKGMAQGMEKGMEQGMEQGAEKIILCLLADGMPVSKIADITRLSIEEVEDIKNKTQR